MKIIDTNILNRFVKDNFRIDSSEVFCTTEDMRSEIENLKSISLDYRIKIGKLNFINVESQDCFSESRYLENYRSFINKYNNIVSFYGLKGMGDISILACVAILLEPINQTLFNTIERIEVITHDSDLKDSLEKEFGSKILINDPVIEVNVNITNVP